MKEIEKLEKRKEKFLAVMEMAKNLSEAIFNLQIENVKNQPIPDYKNGCNNVDCGIVKNSECRCEYVISKHRCNPIKVRECDNCKELINKTEYEFNTSMVIINGNSKYKLSCGEYNLLCRILDSQSVSKQQFIKWFIE